MKKILLFWFLAIGMANAQPRIGLINSDTTTRPIVGLSALAWNNNNLYVVKSAGATSKVLLNDKIFLTDNDRVGIGTKTPSEQFEVAGNAKINGSLKIGVGAGVLFSNANGLLLSRNLVANDIPYLGGQYLDLAGGGSVNGSIDITDGDLKLNSMEDAFGEKTRFRLQNTGIGSTDSYLEIYRDKYFSWSGGWVPGGSLFTLKNAYLGLGGQTNPQATLDLGTSGTFRFGNAAGTDKFLRSTNDNGDAAWTTISKATVGLDNVDNTSDMNKPVSSATQTALNAKMPYSGGTFVGNVNYSPLYSQNINADASGSNYQRFRWFVYNPTYNPTPSAESKLVLQTDRLSGANSIANNLVIDNGKVGINISDLDNEPTKALTVNGDIKLTGQPYVNTSLFGYAEGNFVKIGSGGAMEGYNLMSDVNSKFSKTGGVLYGNTSIRKKTAFNSSDTLFVLGGLGSDIGAVGQGDRLEFKQVSLTGVPRWDISNFNSNTYQTNLTFLGQNIGIKRTNPSYNLDVNGTFRAVGNSVFEGNVGVGTFSPTEIVDILGQNETSVKVASSNNNSWRGLKIGNAGATYSSILQRLDTGEMKIEAGLTGWGGFQTFYTSGLERVRVNQIGYVGIGVTNPSQRLHVDGYGKFNSGVVGNGGLLMLGDETSTNGFLLQQNGNVGIGTTSPTSKLQVVGLPVYADNAAAISGGLTAGAFYRTSTGVLMVVY